MGLVCWILGHIETEPTCPRCGSPRVWDGEFDSLWDPKFEPKRRIRAWHIALFLAGAAGLLVVRR